MNSAGRVSYVLGWVFVAITVVMKGLEMANVQAVYKVPTSPWGMLFFACALFLATIASAARENSGTKSRGASA